MIRLAIFLLLTNCYVLCLTDEEFKSALNYLRNYGYLPKISQIPSDKMLSEAVIQFQNMAGMNMTGDLNNDAMEMMNMPRCGMEDMLFDEDKPAMFSVSPARWISNELTYNILSYPTGIPHADVDATIQKAFNIWAKYTNLKFFKRDSPNVNFRVDWTEKDHGDGANFDGRGKVLAHAFYPRSGRIHFDNEEVWSVGDERGFTNIYQVAAHEIGHSLGLRHSDVEQSLMTPYYRYNRDFQNKLHEDDINGIKFLYEEKKMSSKPNRNNRAQLLCNTDSISSVMAWKDSLYVFKGENYIKLNNDLSSGKTEKISNIWNGLTNNVNAVNNEKNIFFFRGNKYWKFTDTKLNEGYPRDISDGFPGIPNNIDSVMYFRNTFIFFKEDQYWVYNPKKFPVVNPVYPKSISNVLKGFPRNLDAVYNHKNGQNIYGFKQSLVYVYNVRDGTVDEPIATTSFFGCKQ